MKNFDTFGIMLDMSRNAVKTVDEIKRFLPLVRKMGYNALFLYIEDTYCVENEPYFGYMRGRYSEEELREIDEFCTSIGMEAIPCMQTLGHLKTLMKWQKHPFDGGGVLLVDDDRTYELIDNMFATLSRCFKSRKIHIGMDEAFDLGRGRHLTEHGYESTDKLMKRHLERVHLLAKKYSFEPMIWSDMLFRDWNKGEYVVPLQEVPEEYKRVLPEGISPVYWDYFNFDEKKYSDMLEMHKQISGDVWFAGGIWTWISQTPNNNYTIRTMRPALDACKKHKIRNVFMTVWQNAGGECSFYSVLPSLCYLAEYAKGNTDEEKIKKRFKSIVGLDYDECIAIDEANFIAGNERDSKGYASNPSRYMLYCDLLNDFMDWTVNPGMGINFAKTAKKMHLLAKKSRKIGYVYKTVATLCDAMAIKYELGLKTRRAYEAGDREELRRLANDEYVRLVKLLEIYAAANEKQWYKENKSSGLEVFDSHIGAIIQRIKTVRRRILSYVNGEIDAIEEYDTPLLPYGPKKNSGVVINVAQCYTSNVM